MQVDIFGLVSITKYKFGNKNIFLLGEMHEKEKLSFLANRTKETKTVIGTVDLLELLMKDNVNSDVEVFLEGGDYKIPFLKTILNFSSSRVEYSSDAGDIFKMYLYGQYKNYINSIKTVYEIDKHIHGFTEKDINFNNIALSNFHKKINFHLVDYRRRGVFTKLFHNEYKYVLRGTEKELIYMENVDFLVQNKLLEFDENGNYVTIFGKMYDLLSDEAQELIDDFMKKTLFAQEYIQQVMDIVALIKLMFYASNKFHRFSSDKPDADGTIIIIGGDFHIYTYNEFLKEKLSLRPIIEYSDNSGKANIINNVDIYTILQNNYDEYIYNVNKIYNNNTVFVTYEIDDLDKEFFSHFTDMEHIEHRYATKEQTKLKTKLQEVFEIINSESKTGELNLNDSWFMFDGELFDILKKKNIQLITLTIIQFYNYYLSLITSGDFTEIDKFYSFIENINIDNLIKYNNLIKENIDQFHHVKHLKIDIDDITVEGHDKQYGLYTEKLIDLLLSVKTGGTLQKFKDIELIEFDAYTQSTNTIKNFITNTYKQPKVIYSTFNKQPISVRGGTSDYVFSLLILILMVLVIFFLRNNVTGAKKNAFFNHRCVSNYYVV